MDMNPDLKHEVIIYNNDWHLAEDWCEQNIDTIVGWLREEAEKRKLPFVAVGAKLLVKRAIAAARKAEKSALHDTTSSTTDSQTSAG